MPTRLRKLEIDRIDLVDVGANPDATVLLFKRAEPEDPGKKGVENPMTDEEVKALEKKATDAEAAVKAADEKVAKLEGELTELKKAKEKDEPVDIWKGVNPEVRKQFEAQVKKADEAEKVAKAERDQRIEKEYIAKAAELKDLPIKADEFGKVLKVLSEKAPEELAKLETVLRAANESIRTNNVLVRAIGKSAPAANSAEGRLEEIAKRYHAEKKAPTIEQAYDLAVKDNSALYAQYVDEKKVK